MSLSNIGPQYPRSKQFNLQVADQAAPITCRAITTFCTSDAPS